MNVLIEYDLKMGEEYPRSIFYMRYCINVMRRNKGDLMKVNIIWPDVIRPENKLSLYIELYNLYFVAFENTIGLFWFEDFASHCGYQAVTCGPARKMEFSTHYQHLAAFAGKGGELISESQVRGAVAKASKMKTDLPILRESQMYLAMLACITSEAARFHLVATGFEAVFTNKENMFLTKKFIQSQINNYRALYEKGDDYVLVVPGPLLSQA